MILTLPGHDQILLKALREAAEKQAAETAIIDLSDNTAMLGLYGPSSYESVTSILPYELDQLQPGGIMRISIFFRKRL